MTRSGNSRSLIGFYHGPALLVRARKSVTKVITWRTLPLSAKKIGFVFMRIGTKNQKPLDTYLVLYLTITVCKTGLSSRFEGELT
jgi:hypothetical protein